MRRRAQFSPLAIFVAILFGAAAVAAANLGLNLPIPGTSFAIGPSESLVTIGSALTGPLGAIVIGVLAGIAEPTKAVPVIFGHVVGGLWLGFAYRRIICEHLQMPAGLIVWALFVLIYFYVFLIPGIVLAGFVLGVAGVGPTSTVADLSTLARGTLPEALFTTVITTVVLAALPPSFRRPLW